MPTTLSDSLTLQAAIKAVAAAQTAAIPLDRFVEQVLQLYASRAKNPQANIRTEIRSNSSNYGLVFIDPQRSVIVPLRLAVAGLRFRQVITNTNLSARLLLLGQAEQVFLPPKYGIHTEIVAQLQLQDEAGRPQPFQIKSVNPTGDFDFFAPARFGLHMPAWLREHKAAAGDSILFTVLRYDPPIWRIEHEPRAAFDAAAAAQRDAELVQILYVMLEAARAEHLGLKESLIAAYQRVADRAGDPGAPWPAALATDGRMRSDGITLTYSDSPRSALVRMFDLAPKSRTPRRALSNAETSQIYRFKVEAAYRRRFWREVEIQGKQTWANLNSTLVDAFAHDSDHLGGFWRLIHRGAGKKFRESELAKVDPFGEGENAGSSIAEANLEPGDLLKWVFDFGDWYEYRLTLTAITPAEQAKAATKYPRIVAQNAPAHKHCTECLTRGQEVVAYFICIDCSNKTQAQYMLCKRCAGKHSDDHYVQDYAY